MAASIGSAYIEDACIDSTCAIGIWIGCADDGSDYIIGIYARSAFVEGVRPKTLAGSRVILADLVANDYYFILSMRLIFALTDSVSHYFISN